MHKKGLTQHEQVVLKTQGGELQIKFKSLNSGYTDIWLIGPAEKVFKGEVKW